MVIQAGAEVGLSVCYYAGCMCARHPCSIFLTASYQHLQVLHLFADTPCTLALLYHGIFLHLDPKCSWKINSHKDVLDLFADTLLYSYTLANAVQWYLYLEHKRSVENNKWYSTLMFFSLLKH